MAYCLIMANHKKQDLKMIKTYVEIDGVPKNTIQDNFYALLSTKDFYGYDNYIKCIGFINANTED